MGEPEERRLALADAMEAVDCGKARPTASPTNAAPLDAS
jgi:hypothetical protein